MRDLQSVRSKITAERARGLLPLEEDVWPVGAKCSFREVEREREGERDGDTGGKGNKKDLTQRWTTTCRQLQMYFMCSWKYQNKFCCYVPFHSLSVSPSPTRTHTVLRQSIVANGWSYDQRGHRALGHFDMSDRDRQVQSISPNDFKRLRHARLFFPLLLHPLCVLQCILGWKCKEFPLTARGMWTCATI